MCSPLLQQNVHYIFIFIHTAVDKMIRTLVFSPVKMVLSLQCVSRKYRFIFPNAHFAINCNNPVRLLSDNSQCSSQRSDLIIISLSEWHEEAEQTETKSRRRGGSRGAQECVCVSTAPGVSVCVCVSTAPGVCALGWVKCRAQISLLVILCITVYVTNKKVFISFFRRTVQGASRKLHAKLLRNSVKVHRGQKLLKHKGCSHQMLIYR